MEKVSLTNKDMYMVLLQTTADSQKQLRVNKDNRNVRKSLKKT